MNPTRRRPTPIVPILAALLLLAAGAAAAETTVVDGVPHVRNAAVPRDGVEHVHLDEIWSAGGEDDDVLFGLITRVRADAEGNLYVLDGQLSQAHVYDRDGNRLRSLFGEGDGPGEIRGPRDLVLLGDGRVGAVQEVPGRLIMVDRENNPAGMLTVGGPGADRGNFCQTFGAFAGGGVLLMAGFQQAPGDAPNTLKQTSFLSAFDAEGRETAAYCRDDHVFDFGNFVFEESRHLAGYWWNAAVAADGRAYVAPALDRYEIRVHAPDGALERVIERDYEPVRRTGAEKAAFVETVKAIYAGAPIEVEVEPMDVEPVVQSMHRGLRAHADGTLWVLTARGLRDQPDGVLAAFDVFDAEGIYAKKVVVHAEGDPENDAVFFLDDGRAVVVTAFADATLSQFTGASLPDDGTGDAGGMMLRCCRVRR